MHFELSYPEHDGTNPRDSPDIYWLVPLLTPFIDKTREYESRYLDYDEELDRQKTVTSKDIYYNLHYYDDKMNDLGGVDFVGYDSKNGMIITDIGGSSYKNVMNKMIEITNEILKQNPKFKLYVNSSAIPTYTGDAWQQNKEEWNNTTEMGKFRPSYNKILALGDEIVWVPNKGFESPNSLTSRIAVKNNLPPEISRIIKEYNGPDKSFFPTGRGGKRKTKTKRIYKKRRTCKKKNGKRKTSMKK